MIIKKKSLNEKIDSFYEDYKDGKITLEERERRIQAAKDGAYLKTVMENFDVDINATPMERFNTVKEYLYIECEDGRISVDERERLISMFRKDCMGE